ncbi:hypothetical protein TNCV_4812961 [Trichonephila clavipes]|nr:hypothetical protein TNCV_4812961 [Trichonephila clavipes]
MTRYGNKKVDYEEFESEVQLLTAGLIRDGLKFTTATRGLLVTDLTILNHGQVTRTTPELASSSSNYHTTPTEGRLRS